MPGRRRTPEAGARAQRRGAAALTGFRSGAALFGGAKGMKWGMSIRGAGSLLRKYKMMPKVIGFATLDAVSNVLVKVEEEAKRLIMDGYYRPAYQTGKLLNSITGQITHFDLWRVEGEVGTNVYYSVYVHEGTYFMKERQFLADALENKKKMAVNQIKRAIKRDMKRMTIL